MLPPFQSPFVTSFHLHRTSYPHSRLFLTLFMVSVKQKTIAGEEGSRNLFSSCMEKNNDHALLFWGDWRKSLFFSPAPLTPLLRLALQCKANGSGRWVRLVLSCGDSLGILLRRERTRLLCLRVFPAPLAFRRSRVPCFGGAGERGPPVRGCPASSPVHLVVRAPASCYGYGN